MLAVKYDVLTLQFMNGLIIENVTIEQGENKIKNSVFLKIRMFWFHKPSLSLIPKGPRVVS